MYISPLVLYQLSVLPLPKGHWLAQTQSLSKLLRSGRKLMVHRQICCQHLKQLVLLDVGYVVDNVDPPYRGEKCVVFLAILAVARMVIWETQKKELYDGKNFSHHDLIMFFRHQLRVKIRCDRKCLDIINFDKR